MDQSNGAQKLSIARQSDKDEEFIVLDDLDPIEFFRDDIIRHRISGTIPALPNLGLANFIESIIYKAQAIGVDFSQCDFKDSIIKESRFDKCVFDNGTFVTDFFSDCQFTSCTFYNVAIHSSDFHRVSFIDCDLTNLLIKSSRFTDCSFISCKTSNKLLEMSLVDGLRLSNTQIQIQTITSNFGIASTDLEASSIRSGRIREPFRMLEPSDLLAELEDPRLSPIEKLRLQYFLNQDLSVGSLYLDQSLDLSRWTRIYKNPGSFVELLESFSEFLVRLYDADRLATHSLLLLQHITSALSAAIPARDDLHRVTMSLGGTQLVLSRLLEDYFLVLDDILEENNQSLTFLVEGPLDKSYFLDEFSHWFANGTLMISKLVKRNSPLELTVTAADAWTFAPFIAAFLASRTRVEITRLRNRRRGKVSPKAKTSSRSALGKGFTESPESALGQKILSLSSGFENDEDARRYKIQLQCLLPGSLALDLRITFSTRLAGRLRKIIVDLLSEGDQRVDEKAIMPSTPRNI